MFSQFALIVSHAIFCAYSRGDNSLSPQDRYNEAIALFLARVSSSVYCPADTISNWGCASCSASGPMQSTKVVENEKRDFQGIGAYSPFMNAIVIAFRGSSNRANQVADITIVKTKAYKAYPEAQVHVGFYSLYQQVSMQVVQQVEEIRKEHANAVILVTGHSLGGAVAMICAFELEVLHGLEVEALYTFGQPRVGNYPFAKLVEDRVPPICIE